MGGLFYNIENHDGVDITAITRIAEAAFQLDRLFESVSNLFFGLGIAAETRFSDDFFDILSTVYSKDFEFIGHGFGHNTYIGIFYTGGLLSGSVFLYCLIKTVLLSVKSFKWKFNSGDVSSENLFLIAWGGSSAIGFGAYMLLSGLFGDRLASFSLGLMLGLIYLGVKKNQFILR